MQRILGIDPGSRVTGYALIESDGSRSLHVAHGCIRTESRDFPSRLGEIFTGIVAVIAEFQPQAVAIEDVFVARNAASALKLGQARGAAICAAVNHGLPVSEYTPRAVKQSIVGSGAADKEQVQHMVKMMLNIKQKLALDASDALAIALTHAHTEKTSRLIQGAKRW